MVGLLLISLRLGLILGRFVGGGSAVQTPSNPNAWLDENGDPWLDENLQPWITE
jgi:hypothetical protein